jgi:hypothetical protein
MRDERAWMQKLNPGRRLSRPFAASRQQVRDVSKRLGLRRAVNPGSCRNLRLARSPLRQPAFRRRSAIPCAARANTGSDAPGFSPTARIMPAIPPRQAINWDREPSRTDERGVGC